MTITTGITHIPMTLQAFSDDLDNLFDELRYGDTFAQAVTGLWVLNHQKAQLDARKKVLAAAIEKAPSRRLYRDALSKYGDLVIKRVDRKPRPPIRTVRAADIKEYNKDLYEAARILKPRVEARNDRRKPPDWTLPIIDSTKLARMWEAKIELADITKDLNAAHQPLRNRLIEIAGIIGWDGRTLSLDKSEGWHVKTMTLMYSADELRRIAPGTYAKLEREYVSELPKQRTVLQVHDPEDDDEMEYDEPIGN